MTQYTTNHAESLQKRAYAVLDLYNKEILDNEMTQEKWNSIFMENSSIMDINLPDAPHLSWEELNHRLLNVQIDLLTEMGIYCTKEIVLTLWGLDLAALYHAKPTQKHLDKLLFATELICYAEASLSVTLFKNRSDVENLFVAVKSKAKSKRKQDYVGFEAYFSDQSNFIKYWRKIPLYETLVDCFLNKPEIQAFIDDPDNTVKNLKKAFNVDAFIQSDELTEELNKLEQREIKEDKPQKEASKLLKSGTRGSFRAPTNKLIQLLPDCIHWVKEDKISPKDALMREIRNGALYKLKSQKAK